MMRKRIWFLMAMILGVAYSFASEISVPKPQIRCEAKFFDRYEKYVGLLFRIRHDILLQQKSLARYKIRAASRQSYSEVCKEMLLFIQACDVAHHNMFADFEKCMNDYKEEADREFFKQYLAERMVEQTKRVEDVKKVPVKNSSEQTPLLHSENVDSKWSVCIQLFRALFCD